MIVRLSLFLALICSFAAEVYATNVIVIMTDEHNLRTISSYRDHLLTKYPKESVDVWGDGVFVETPHIDSLVENGVLFSNFYASSPMCTPARASFLTGLYPRETGAHFNHVPMKETTKTWAEVLQHNGYYTSYIGKIHLDGDAKPGWEEEEGRDFGFNHTTYRYNRGHWKCFQELEDGSIKVFNSLQECENEFDNVEKYYSTDFLMDRGMEFLEEMAKEKDQPFALFLSLPDPHEPNSVREPYKTMYSDLDIGLPPTAEAMILRDPSVPDFYRQTKYVKYNSSLDYEDAEEYIASLNDIDSLQAFQNKQYSLPYHVKSYFGMVKLIDDKLGQLLSKLKSLNMDDCVIVFTSDHGDTLGEHGVINKGLPYEASVGIPMIINYPKKLTGKTVIETAYSQIDFTPTLLGLLDIGDTPQGYMAHGVDGSNEILQGKEGDGNTQKPKLTANNDKIIISSYKWQKNETAGVGWLAAIKNGYKYIVDLVGYPTFFDLNSDPDELYNVISMSEHKEVLASLKDAILEHIAEHGSSYLQDEILFLDPPSCRNKNDVLKLLANGGNENQYIYCNDVESDRALCSISEVRNHCPISCEVDCQDSIGEIYFKGIVATCQDLADECQLEEISSFCPQTCESNPCSDDSNFKFRKPNGKLSKCAYIMRNKFTASKRREKFCKAQVSESCKYSCGLCRDSINNDDNFEYMVGNSGVIITCDKLLQFGRKRRQRHCERIFDGIPVKDRCHLSCGNF